MILQSHMPDHYALGLACAQDYDAFFEREMEFRRTMGYPPVAALVNLIVRGDGRRRRGRPRRTRLAARAARRGGGAATACSAPPTRRWRGCATSTASRSC